MSPRTRKRLIVTLGVCAALVLLLGAFVGWMTTTQAGARWGFERLSTILPGELDVREMRGPLRGPLEVRHLVYRNERMEMTIDRLTLDWRLNQLLRRQLDIRRLHAENVRILLGASGDTPAERDSLDDGLPDVDLPVSILVRDGDVRGLQITMPGNDSGMVIDRVTLDGSTFRDSLRIHRFVVRSKTLDVDLTGRALPLRSYPLELTGSWTLRPPDGREIAGTGTIAGELGGTIHVRQQVTRPFAMRLDGRVTQALRRPQLEADIDFEDLELRALDPGYPEGVFSGHLQATGRLDDLAGRGTVRGRTPQLGLAHADFRFRHRGDVWAIDNAAVMLPGEAVRFTGRGTVTGSGPAMRMRFDTEWRDLDWPLRGTPVVESDRGSARIDGTLQRFHLRLEGLLAGRDLPPGRWSLDGHGGHGRLAIRTVIADMLNGRITGSGAVAWEPRVEWRLGFEGRAIDPGSVWIEWPGQVDFTARSEGAMTRSGPVGSMLVSRLGGMLRGHPLTGSGMLRARGPGYTLENAAVQWGRDSLQASGDMIDRWSLDFRLAAPALSQLPQGSGSLTASGTVRGPGGRPHLVASAAGESLFYQNWHAGSLRASGDLDFAPAGVMQLDVAATEVDVDRHSFERVSATARGTQAAHELRAALAGRGDSLVAVAAGGLARAVWSGELRALDLVKPETGHWTLASPAPLTASAQRASISDFAWRSGPSRLTLAADWDRSGPWRVDARLDSVALALLAPFVPPDVRLSGAMNGRVMARATPDGRLFADVNVTPGAGEISTLTATGQWVPTRFENAALRVGADGRGLDGTLSVDLVNVGTVRGSVTMPRYAVLSLPSAQQPIEGRLSAHLRDLALAQAFSPELDATGGTLDADLAFGGTLARPSVHGRLDLRDGRAEVPRLGLQFQEITVLATGTPAGQLAIEGGMRSGEGRLTLTGTANVADRGTPSAELNVRGERVQALNTRDGKVWVSPDLRATLKGARVDLTGEVRVPEGNVTLSRPSDRPAVRVSRDVVYTTADTLERGQAEVHARVRLVLGENVRVQGFGLNIRPEGSVLATNEPGLPPLGAGELVAREGTYRIYGQELAIERARLIFGGGPIQNPGLDVRAARTADDGTIAGFEVHGTLEQPDLKVFSEPSRGQSQALAYILFGHPIERSNLSQGQLVSTMATTMGVGGTEMLAHGIASGLGIEQVRIHAGQDLQSTSLMLGQHLSPKLYLGYGIGLFEQTPAVQLRYVIDRRWTIEMESARQSRVDAMFSIER